MMDTKEALKELEDLIVDYGDRNEEQIARLDEAIDMAMDALRNLPNRLRQAMDTISRQAAVEACYNGWNKDYRGIAQDIKDLPSAQPKKRTEERTETHACDLISRQAAMEEISKQQTYKMFEGEDTLYLDANDVGSVLASLPSAQPERLTDDDFETIRIHLNAYKEKLCNQQRWEEADEYQRILDRFMSFASAQPEQLTDKEQRIFLAAMGREEKVCKQVDDECRNCRESYEDSLVRTCHEITRKVKGALWMT